jgi:glycosyltransferase involved in cell wall biosynthesis
VPSIVHVLSSFGVGGQERVALDLAAGQIRRGSPVLAVSLAAPPDGPLAAEFRDAGAEVLTVAKRGGGLDPSLTPRLAWHLRARHVDVVHTHNPLPLIYAAPAARLVGAVAIHTKHGLNPGSRGNLMLRRAAARLVSAFVAVSDVTAAQARRQRDCDPAKLVVIPNGIRLERFRPDPDARRAIRAELGIPDDAWVVGTVGRIDEVKNQPMLVRAIAPMLGDRSRLVIVGDGPARAALDAAVAAVAEPRYVHLLGRRMDVDRILPALDVFALSSLTEGLPLVVPEAMAAGLPVVATAVGGVPDVVADGDTGLLCSVDEGALRERLATLAADEPMARAMGEAAREAALGQYSAERMIDDYQALYARALAARAA